MNIPKATVIKICPHSHLHHTHHAGFVSGQTLPAIKIREDAYETIVNQLYGDRATYVEECDYLKG
jgi:hypothetical protein